MHVISIACAADRMCFDGNPRLTAVAPALQKAKIRGSGRKDDAFVVSDGHESEEDEDGGKREYVVVGDDSDSDEENAPIGMAAIEQLTAQRKVCITHGLDCVKADAGINVISRHKARQ